jgi:hypothetical protein
LNTYSYTLPNFISIITFNIISTVTFNTTSITTVIMGQQAGESVDDAWKRVDDNGVPESSKRLSPEEFEKKRKELASTPVVGDSGVKERMDYIPYL